ncbi:MAG: M23 family metallopeptidase [Acidobacteria bacterium]|nr:M23 family metallopeptidase [Acidobacteriota bacterium]
MNNRDLHQQSLQRERSESGAVGLVFLLMLAVVSVIFLVREIRSPAPEVHVLTERKGIGQATPLSVSVSDRRGLRSLEVILEQGGQSIPVLSETYASRLSWRAGPKNQTREVTIGTQQQKELKDGEATLHIVARNKNWFSSSTSLDRTLAVRSRPPSLSVRTGGIIYMNQAGSEMVIYSVSPGTVSSGVRVGKYFFPGFPLPGGQSGDRLALFAFPYDLPTATIPKIIARDDAENESQATFAYRLFPKKFRHREIGLTDQFMEATVPAIMSHTPELKDQGDLLKNFLVVNGELRKANRAQIAEMGKDTVPEFLWEGAFMQLTNSAVESQFADFRSYIYQGKKVDEQVHLGFDLAVVIHGPVAAANSGRVIFADYLGIYGNTIVLDHGFGLQTLYAHLNSFKVKPGDKVAKGQVIADSGSTGLAGGDHLHFTTLLHGIEVNPVEWWDKLWIEKHLMDKLAAANAGATATTSTAAPQER